MASVNVSLLKFSQCTTRFTLARYLHEGIYTRRHDSAVDSSQLLRTVGVHTVSVRREDEAERNVEMCR